MLSGDMIVSNRNWRSSRPKEANGPMLALEAAELLPKTAAASNKTIATLSAKLVAQLRPSNTSHLHFLLLLLPPR